jgi:hypothetical protein
MGLHQINTVRIAEVPKPLSELLHCYLRVEDPPVEKDAQLFWVDRSRGMTAGNIEKMIQCRLKSRMNAATERG